MLSFSTTGVTYGRRRQWTLSLRFISSISGLPRSLLPGSFPKDLTKPKEAWALLKSHAVHMSIAYGPFLDETRSITCGEIGRKPRRVDVTSLACSGVQGFVR